MSMLGCLFLAFVVVPLADLFLLVSVASQIGLLPSIAAVILTAVAGSVLVRHAGLAALTRIQTDVSEGRAPTDALLHGAAVLAAGAMLLAPGFITDAAALLLLLPPGQALLGWTVRRWAASQIKVQMSVMPGPFGSGVGGASPFGQGPFGPMPGGGMPGPAFGGTHGNDDDIIEGEVISRGPADPTDPSPGTGDEPERPTLP